MSLLEKNKKRILWLGLLGVMLLFLIHVNATIYESRPTTSSDPQSMAINDSYAYDSSSTTYTFINASISGNFSMYSFDVGSHSNSEDIKRIDLYLDMETYNFSASTWAILYSEDAGNTWNILRDYSSDNLSRQIISFNDIQELTDNDWTWNEISGDLWIRISINGNGNGSIKLYEVWINVTVDDNPPIVNLESPISNYNTTSSIVSFYYNVSDELSGIENCSLLINGIVNATNTSIVEGVTLNFTVSLGEGEYNWSVECYDNSSVYNRGVSEQRVIRIDQSPPSIDLLSPLNDSVWNISNDVNFSFKPSDITAISNCSLYINGSLAEFSSNVLNNQENLFTVYLENGFYEWWVNCTDIMGFENESQHYYLTVDVDLSPIVKLVVAPSNISLLAASNVSITCNATITDPDGLGEINNVKAVLYHYSSNINDPDTGEVHYTNNSCIMISNNGIDANYSCGFSITYYARPGTWTCNITATDIYNVNGSNTTTTTINELYAASVEPLFIDYGILNPGHNSSSDEIVIVYNRGNTEIDVALTGYAFFMGDGLAMNCTRGNISIGYEHYSMIPGLVYSSMTPLTTSLIQLDDFNLAPRTDSSDSYKYLYWKLGMPKGVKGNCSGYVRISIVPS